MSQLPDPTSAARTTSPIRVLHVAQPTFAGVMVVVRDLANEQIKQGLDVIVACPESGGELSNHVRAVGAQWIKWEATRNPGPSAFSESLSLRRIIADVKPDIVHLHSSKAGLAGRLAIRGRIPTVFEPNAWSFLAVSGMMYKAAVQWERWAARWTHTTVCVSEDERSAGHAVGIRNVMQVIQNGIQLDKWPKPTLEEASTARVRLGIPDDVLHVVSVGRLCRQKGQDLLLKAWLAVQAKFPTARLTLVGEGADRGTLEAMAPPSVTFAGDSKAVRDWYLSADLVVMPSRWEGLSLALLEAMATQKTVVAFNVAGMKDALSNGAGVLVTPESVSELESEISRLLSDANRLDSIASAARIRVETDFDICRKGIAVSSLYRQLLQSRSLASETSGTKQC